MSSRPSAKTQGDDHYNGDCDFDCSCAGLRGMSRPLLCPEEVHRVWEGMVSCQTTPVATASGQHDRQASQRQDSSQQRHKARDPESQA